MRSNDLKPTARIRPAKDNSLWLLVNPPGSNVMAAEDLNDFITETLGVRDTGAVAYAILPEEVEAIMLACKEYLERAK